MMGGNTLQRREKGNSAERGRETRRARGGRSRRNISGCPLAYNVPEGQLPAGDERSDHKVELHSL